MWMLLTILTALQLLTVLLLQGQLSLQLGDASLGQLPAQLLVFLNQHSTLGHQFLPRLAARETSLTSHNEPGDKQQAKRCHWPASPTSYTEPLQPWLSNHNKIFIISIRLQCNIELSGTHTQIRSVQKDVNYFWVKLKIFFLYTKMYFWVGLKKKKKNTTTVAKTQNKLPRSTLPWIWCIHCYTVTLNSPCYNIEQKWALQK